MRIFRNRAREFDHATPVIDRHGREGFTGLLIKMALAVLIPLALFWQFGQPAMLIEYDYQGGQSGPRWMTGCHYASLTGWQHITPMNGHCPVFMTVPVGILSFLGVSK